MYVVSRKPRIFYEVLVSTFFLGGVLPHVLKNKAWGILHNLVEMFSYRLPFIPQNYRIHLISHIHSITAIPHTNQNYQLHLW
jgi:mediator of RNA polymerase II transcription subunit 23